MRILLVEDERKVASFIARALRENSYAVDVAETGEKALPLATDVTFDAILLDVRLPGMSGLEVCRELRQQGVEAPILMLTARGLVEQRVAGLDAGADDYLAKPFALAELLARVRALVRRGFHSGNAKLRSADLSLDRHRRRDPGGFLSGILGTFGSRSLNPAQSATARNYAPDNRGSRFGTPLARHKSDGHRGTIF